MTGKPILQDFFRLYFSFNPHEATERGYPGFDDRAPHFTRQNFNDFKSALSTLEERLGSEKPRDIDEEIDCLLLRSAIKLSTFFADSLDWIRTNPLFHVKSLLESIEELDLREDIPETKKDEFLQKRLLQVAVFLQDACNELRDPVDCLTDAALEMIDAAIIDLGERYPKGECPAPLHEAGEGARHALGKAHERLTRLRSDARPFTPMGEERYRWLLRSLHFLDDDLSRYRQIGEETIQEAKRLRAGFDASEVQEEQPPPDFGADQVWEYLREEMEYVRNFVIENRLVSVPDGEVRIRETPPYLQPILGGASYQPPPAFFSGARTGQFFLPPVPREMTRAQKQHYHKIVLNRWRRNLIVHEVYPGHHVQFLHALAHPSGIRKLHDNDMMVEGWAFYCEHLLYETGLFDGAPSPRPAMNQHFRGVRVFVDLGIHTGEMDFAGAERYMREMLSVKTSDWVTREIVRYITEPTQALSYAVGRQMILDLRKEYRDAKGESGFSLFEFHNRFLSEGSIPIPLIRRKLFARPASADS